MHQTLLIPPRWRVLLPGWTCYFLQFIAWERLWRAAKAAAAALPEGSASSLQVSEGGGWVCAPVHHPSLPWGQACSVCPWVFPGRSVFTFSQLWVYACLSPFWGAPGSVANTWASAASQLVSSYHWCSPDGAWYSPKRLRGWICSAHKPPLRPAFERVSLGS